MANKEVRLSNGKTLILREYGWVQPRDQREKYGELSEVEHHEAWRLWDENKKNN